VSNPLSILASIWLKQLIHQDVIKTKVEEDKMEEMVAAKAVAKIFLNMVAEEELEEHVEDVAQSIQEGISTNILQCQWMASQEQK
jgi:hypothetical protein